MKKRILAMLLTICMVIALLPTVAFAAETTVTTEQELRDAIAAGGNVKLGSSVTVTGTAIDVTKAVTLDLNGNTITDNVQNARLFNVTADFTVTANGGSMEIPVGNTASQGLFKISATSDFKLTGGTYTGSTLENHRLITVLTPSTDTTSKVNVTLEDVTASTNYCAYASITNGGVKLAVKGGSYTTTVDGLDAFADLVYGDASDNEMSFDNVTINSLGNCVEVITGTATFKDCTFQATGTGAAAPWNNSAVAVSNCGVATIESGSYTSTQGCALYVFSSGGQIIVNGGSVSGGRYAIESDLYDGYKSQFLAAGVKEYVARVTVNAGTVTGGYKTSGSSDATIVLTGGTFSADPSDYVPSTHKVTEVTGDTTTYNVEVAGMAVSADKSSDGKTKTVTLTGSFDQVTSNSDSEGAVDADNDGATAKGSASTTSITVDATVSDNSDDAVTTTAVNIPAATVGSLNEAEATPSVTVKTNAGSVQLDSKAMEAVIAAASTGEGNEKAVTKDVSISLTKTVPDSGDTKAAYDVEVKVGTGADATEPLSKGNTAGASITLTLPKPDSDEWYIYYALPNGSDYSPLELMASSSKYDQKDGMVVINTNHLSTYIERDEAAGIPQISAFDYAYSKTAADEAMLEDIKAVSANPGSATTPNDYDTNTMWTVLSGLDKTGTYKVKYYYEESTETYLSESIDFTTASGKYITYFSFDSTKQVAADSLKEGKYTSKLYQKVGTEYVLIDTEDLNIYNNIDLASDWQSYSSEDEAMKTLVPDTDVLYNVKYQSTLMAGFSALWSAAKNEYYTTSQADHQAAVDKLAELKTKLLTDLKNDNQALLDAKFNAGAGYTVSDTTYYIPTYAYDKATQDIKAATTIAAVVDALSTAVNNRYALGSGEKTVTVTLNAGGGKFSDGKTTKVAIDKDSVFLDGLDLSVSRYGCSFKGWYTSDGTAVNTTAEFTEDTTIYAQWIYLGSSTTSTAYAVSIASAEGGKVTASDAKAPKDTEVTLTVTANEGKALDTLTVTDASGNKLKVTKNTDGTYYFIMPASVVTVKATFKDADQAQEPEEPEEPAQTVSFTDVDASKWYNSAVEYVVSKGIMEGYGNNKFGPNDNLTRAQLAQILYNAAGAPEVTSESPFTDVTAGKWYTAAITWAYENGVVEGYGNGKFGPNDEITREQLATMIWRYAGEVKATTDSLSSFNDAAKVSSYAQDALLWATEKSIVQGDKNVLDPKGNATRAQAATMIMRYLELG